METLILACFVSNKLERVCPYMEHNSEGMVLFDDYFLQALLTTTGLALNDWRLTNKY